MMTRMDSSGLQHADLIPASIVPTTSNYKTTFKKHNPTEKREINANANAKKVELTL